MNREDLNLGDVAESQNVELPDDLSVEELVPDDPGPAITGNTPVLGSLRRGDDVPADVPVLRDQIKKQLDI